MPHGEEKAALLRQCAAVGDDGKGVHLQCVIVEKAERLMPDNALIKNEAAALQPLRGTRMAGVEYGHIVFLRHLVYGGEE